MRRSIDVRPDEVESILDYGSGIDRYCVNIRFLTLADTIDDIVEYSLLLNSIGDYFHDEFIDAERETNPDISEEECRKYGIVIPKLIEWEDLPEPVRRSILVDLEENDNE